MNLVVIETHQLITLPHLTSRFVLCNAKHYDRHQEASNVLHKQQNGARGRVWLIFRS